MIEVLAFLAIGFLCGFIFGYQKGNDSAKEENKFLNEIQPISSIPFRTHGDEVYFGDLVVKREYSERYGVYIRNQDKYFKTDNYNGYRERFHEVAREIEAVAIESQINDPKVKCKSENECIVVCVEDTDMKLMIKITDSIDDIKKKIQIARDLSNI